MALVVWWVWVVFAAANLLDLAIQGHDHFAAVVAAVLVLITGITFVAAFRPRVLAGDEGLTIKNPLRDHQVPWGCVESLDLRDSLEVHCRWQDGGPRRKKLYAWAVHSPRRSRLRAEMRGRRKLSSEEKQPTAFARLPPEAKTAAIKSNEEQIVDSLRARAAKSGEPAEPNPSRPVSTWDRLAIAVLVLPVVLVVIAVLT
jgi:hypothetical protein